MRQDRFRNPAVDHLPTLLAGPFALAVLLVAFAGSPELAYPIILGGLLVMASGLPWFRVKPRRAPPLHAALG